MFSLLGSHVAHNNRCNSLPHKNSITRNASMTINGKAYIVGISEHPTRRADGISTAKLHADVAIGALADAGLSVDDIDGYFCGADAPGIGGLTIAEYIGLRRLRYLDSTETGGSSYMLHVHHAARAIAEGRCNVALMLMTPPDILIMRQMGV